MLVRCRNASETGWFGSKLVKKVAKGVTSVAKVATKIPGVSLMTAPARLAVDVARGKNVVASVKKQAGNIVADTRASLPIAAGVVSFVPGVGTGIATGLSAASAISQGKSLRGIAEEAALGAVPGGQLARAALRAGIGVARGQNVLRTVGNEGIAYARQNLPGGEIAQRGLNVALNVAKGGNVAKSVAREGISYARANVPLPSLPANVQSVVSAVTSNVPKVPMNLTRPNFGLPASVSPENVARIRQVSVGLRRPNYRGNIAPTVQRSASFRPLSMATRSWLVKGLPHMRGEVSGLSETGAQWIVESGDTGSKIALKLTGNANRWTELRAINPKIMGRGAAAVAKYGFPVYVNDKVNLPASWIKPVAQTAAQSAPATPTPAAPPPVVMPAGDLAAQGQARTILTAWGKTDGKTEAGVPDYGSQSELLSSSWTARDVLQGNSFANWWRRFGGPPAVDDGNWSESLSVALNRWAEGKAATVTNSAIAAGGFVLPPVLGPAPAAAQQTMPTPVGAALPTPSISLPSPWATTPSAPAATVPSLPSGSTPTQISLPQVTITSDAMPALTPFPSVISAPSAPAPVAQANVAPQSKAGLTESQKWGLGSMAAGTAISILVRLIAA
jgi:hypothetical protein